MLVFFKRKLATPKIREEKSPTSLHPAVVLMDRCELAGKSEREAHPAAGVETMEGLRKKSGKVIASVLLLPLNSQPSTW